MKKILAVLLAVITVLSCVACGGKVYEADAKEFSSNGMTITLTEAFKESSYEGYTVCYDSSEVAVFVLKESFSLQAGLSELSVKDYADLVYQANAAKSPEAVVQADGLTYMEYTFFNEAENVTYKYFSTMHKGTDAFWLVQFATEEGNYDSYKPYLIEWAKSVDVSAAS